MANLTAAHLAIDPVHCRAICDEIGERLRYLLKREISDIPPHLLILLDKFAELEFAPSIVPSMDEMSAFKADRVYNAKRSIRSLATAEQS
jgi:predicted transcriptional regulator